MTPATAAFPKGVKQPLQALATYSDGSNIDVTTQAAWQSSHPDIVRIDAPGVVRGQTMGNATVTATFAEFSAQADVTVTPATLSHLAITPASLSLPKGLKQPLQARATYSDNSVIDVTEQASWSSSNANIVRIDAPGVIRGQTTGKAAITATFDGQSAQAEITVTPATLSHLTMAIEETPTETISLPAGVTQALEVWATYSDGSDIDVTTQAVWQSSHPGIVQIDAPGVVRGQAMGNAMVTATFGGLSAQAEITVTPATLSRLAITPGSVTLPMGPTQQFQVLAIYSDGSDSDVTTQAAWQSSHPNIVQIDSTGVARSLAAGEATITATFGGLSAHADVTVPPTTLSSLTIDPASLSFPKGIKQQIKAWATYSDDSTIDVTTQVDWSSAEPDIVAIDDKGIVTGLAFGNAVIIATLGELSAQAEVSVISTTLSHLAISPATLSLPKGIKQPLLALATYSDGRIIDVTAQAAWQSSDAQIVAIQRANRARFDAPVVAIGLASGSVTLTAHFGEQAASIEEATITPATLTRLVITPDAFSLPIGGRQPLQVQAIYTDNSLFDVTPQVAWSSNNPSIVDVDTNGIVTGRASGNTEITAQFDGHTVQTHPRVLRPGRVVTWGWRDSGGIAVVWQSSSKM
ncbi:Ig-like domain-containing protein [Aeromonas simiae]|uniref:Ig-like domain-containing protein n=1 Tax=Aeromonas simiae TaxID=218936 RepID=UPI00266D2CE7|nr:Ig-like domain-containing protein [Aeromonas simiae]MDO2949138.1 Ig-like domain-containing protein [Aeromonas simiae]MDO2952655.1 Ig-like domain-containing protein [Aeromonas simiae]MDO2956356.1 Ig-like domain-containing protein [Aeromonas simiae]